MSVFIRDMNVPTRCIDCTFAQSELQLRDDEPAETHCIITNESVTPLMRLQRGDNCPLVDGEEYCHVMEG